MLRILRYHRFRQKFLSGADCISISDRKKYCEAYCQGGHMLAIGCICNTRRSYRFRFLRDFNKNELKLRTVPEKWKGRIQWWKEPIYISPHVNVLQKGVDFTFQDGRPIYVTSLDEVRRKKEQIELGKRIVKLLGEVRDAEEMYKQRLEAEKQENERRLAIVPLPKGTQEIS